jgi:hypothetical protein
MFSTVGWTEYVMTIVIGLVAWYAGILLIFYRKSLGKYFSRKKRVDMANEDTNKIIDKPSEDNTNNNTPKQDALQTVQLMIAEIKNVFASAAKDTPQSEVTDAIKNILSKYPQLQYSEFRVAIGDLLQSTASRAGREPFSAEELEEIWKF